MSTFGLARVDRPACTKCCAMVPEVIVPLTDTDARPMCWYCAHVVTAHDAAPEGAESEHCGCPDSEILPGWLLALRGRAVASDPPVALVVESPTSDAGWGQLKGRLRRDPFRGVGVKGPNGTGIKPRGGVSSEGYLTGAARGAIPRVSGRMVRS